MNMHREKVKALFDRYLTLKMCTFRHRENSENWTGKGDFLPSQRIRRLFRVKTKISDQNSQTYQRIKFCAFISVLRFRIVALGTDSRKRPKFQFLTRLREHRRQFPAVAGFESHPMRFSTTDVIGSSHTDTFSNLGYSANTPITGSEFQSLRNFVFCLLSWIFSFLDKVLDRILHTNKYWE